MALTTTIKWREYPKCIPRSAQKCLALNYSKIRDALFEDGNFYQKDGKEILYGVFNFALPEDISTHPQESEEADNGGQNANT